jgi:hypothetical protein
MVETLKAFPLDLIWKYGQFETPFCYRTGGLCAISRLCIVAKIEQITLRITQNRCEAFPHQVTEARTKLKSMVEKLKASGKIETGPTRGFQTDYRDLRTLPKVE